MGRLLMAVIGCALLCSCGERITADQIERANAHCKAHGGLEYIPSQIAMGDGITFTCNDRAEIILRSAP